MLETALRRLVCIFPPSSINSTEEATEMTNKIRGQLEDANLPVDLSKVTIVNKSSNATAKIAGTYIGANAAQMIMDETCRLMAEFTDEVGVHRDPSKLMKVRSKIINIIPHMNAMVRRQPWEHMKEPTKLFDEAIFKGVCSTLAMSAEDKQYIEQLFWLPFRVGGLGFTKFQELGMAIRLGAICENLLDLREELLRFGFLKPGILISNEIPSLIQEFKTKFGVSEEETLAIDLASVSAINSRIRCETWNEVDMLRNLSFRLHRRAQSHIRQRWIDSFDINDLMFQKKLNSVIPEKQTPF